MNAQANPGITFEAAQNGYHANATARRDAREKLEAALTEKAHAEHARAKGLALAFAKYRGQGKPVAEAEILAKADAADKTLDRDLADAKAKAAQARLAELEGERASLRQLVDWTREES